MLFNMLIPKMSSRRGLTLKSLIANRTIKPMFLYVSSSVRPNDLFEKIFFDTFCIRTALGRCVAVYVFSYWLCWRISCDPHHIWLLCKIKKTFSTSIFRWILIFIHNHLCQEDLVRLIKVYSLINLFFVCFFRLKNLRKQTT